MADDILDPTSWNVLNRRPTAYDVARLAGVSQSMVSRTFTPGASVSSDARAKVLEVARQRATAEAFVKACRFCPGGRGFPGSSRAADFAGRKMQDHIETSNANATAIAQIENSEALNALEEIAAVEHLELPVHRPR